MKRRPSLARVLRVLKDGKVPLVRADGSVLAYKEAVPHRARLPDDVGPFVLIETTKPSRRSFICEYGRVRPVALWQFELRRTSWIRSAIQRGNQKRAREAALEEDAEWSSSCITTKRSSWRLDQARKVRANQTTYRACWRHGVKDVRDIPTTVDVEHAGRPVRKLLFATADTCHDETVLRNARQFIAWRAGLRRATAMHGHRSHIATTRSAKTLPASLTFQLQLRNPVGSVASQEA